MSIQDQIQKIQKQPYETRVKILWGTVIVVAVILIGLWIFGLKNTLKRVDKNSLIQNPSSQNTALSTRDDIAAVEWIEITSSDTKIYFNINNKTSDILNNPKVGNITLQYQNKMLEPGSMTDRQGKNFAVKSLSNTQNFGVLTFNTPLEGSEATLILSGMFFEQNESQKFKQELKLDLTKLNKDGKLRN